MTNVRRHMEDRFRRVSPVAAYSRDRLLSRPTADTQPWRREPRFVPQSGPLPRLCPNALPLQAATLGDGVGEIFALLPIVGPS